MRSAGVVRVLLAAVCLVSAAAHFIQVEADYPAQRTWSLALYTDEGFYTSAAVRHQLAGSFYMPGDYNPVVNLPVFPLVVSAVFRVFGLSLAAARSTALGFFLVLLVAVYGLTRRLAGPTVALLAVLFLATNFTLFSVSRLALLDVPMSALLAASAGVAVLPGRRIAWLPALAASLLFCLAVLTKTVALFALPAIAFLAATRGGSRRARIAGPALVVGTAVVVLGGYHLLTRHFFPEDRAYFTRFVFTPRVSLDPRDILARIPATLTDGFGVAPIFYYPVLAGAPLAWAIFPGLRRDRLVTAALLWGGGFLLVLATNSYRPERYYVPFLVPLAMLASVLTVRMPASPRRARRWLAIPLAIVWGYSCYGESLEVVQNLRHPQFSLRDMGRDVRRLADAEGGGGAYLTGLFANTLSLVTGMPAVNDQVGTRDPSWRLDTYRPRYYVELLYDRRFLGLLTESGLLTVESERMNALYKKLHDDPEARKVLQTWGVLTFEDRSDGKVIAASSPVLPRVRERFAEVAAHHEPYYYMTDHADPAVIATIESRYTLQEMASYDLFANYSRHRAYLFRLTPQAAAQRPR